MNPLGIAKHRPADPSWHVSVLIPACNEETLLPRCLRSVLTATENLPSTIATDIVVAVDRSTDHTREIAERLLRGRGQVVRCDAGAVGKARALAANAALRRYRGPKRRCWLANTDADCQVPATWLTTQLHLAQQGIQAVAGTIDVDNFGEHLPHVAARFRATYLVRPDGSHEHVHGANLGVRADAYLRAGGWSDQATAEDHDLWNRLSQVAAARVSTDKLRVLTSGRRIGRAPDGFAGALAAHSETAA
jgi:glycosyltransferase involved in cell wall biosynthesis